MNKNRAFNIFLLFVFLASAFVFARLLITGEGSFRSIEYSSTENSGYFYFDLVFVGVLMLLSALGLWAAPTNKKESD